MSSLFNRTNALIVLLAVASAGVGLLISEWLRPVARPASASPATPDLKIGDQRPDVTLPMLDGTPRRLSSWDGKLIVLNFWASWCGPCREEMPLLDRARKRHAGQGLEVIGIAADNTADAAGFLREHPVSYPILVDSPQAGPDVSQRFGNSRSVLPYTVLIGRDGRVLAQRFGNFSEDALERWLAPHL
ncbi:MAG: TlpA disulfide reductase family protein [Dokdonella sp.]